MAATQERTPEKIGNATTVETDPRSEKIDLNAPAGSKNSLGAESVRDGRPSTDSDVEEAIDEEGPGISVPPAV